MINNFYISPWRAESGEHGVGVRDGVGIRVPRMELVQTNKFIGIIIKA